MKDSVVQHLDDAGHLDRIFVDGEWVLPAGQERSNVIDPSTEQPVAQIALGNAHDVAAAVDAARRAFATWSVSSPQSRAELLGRVHSLILERAELFAQAISYFVFRQATTRREAVGMSLIVAGCMLLIWVQ